MYLQQGGGRPLIDSEVAEFFTEYNAQVGEVATASQLRAPVGAALFLYLVHEPEKARVFIEKVTKGLNLSEDCAAHRLRIALERMSSRNGSQGRLLAFQTTVSAIIADSENRSVKLLRAATSWENTPWKWALNFAPLAK